METDNDKIRSSIAAELRCRAEEQLKANLSAAGDSPAYDDTRRLLHELQVHRIELDMQNAELRQARDEMETLLEQYTDLYDFAPVGYLTLDRDGIIRTVNLSGAGLLGAERSRLLGRRFGQFVTNDFRRTFADFLVKVLTSRAKVVCEVELLNKEGSPLFVQVEAVAAAAGQECRMAVMDISERKQAEESQRRAKEAAEAATRTKSLFLANMSHELRTPMSGILGLLQFALEEELAPQPREYLETIHSSARSLLCILNDILDMAKIEAGTLTIEEHPFSLSRCLAEAVDMIIPEVRRKGLDFTLSLPDDLPDRVSGDQLRLRQVLLNLLGNAVKFTDRGRISAHVSAGMARSAGRREFMFTVTDSGIGLSADKRPLLFRAFSQVDDSHSRRHGGAGLGLAISREIVERMGGSISFTSEEAVGSTFTFTVPLREAGVEFDIPGSTEAEKTETALPAAADSRTPHLLLAEDDAANRQVLGLMFRLSHYTLDFAEDGRQAVEMWEKGEYDLVLMDVQMPVMDGFEATGVIRERECLRGGHTPIIAMTAHAFQEDRERCLAAGMDGYISKPIDFKKCLQVVEQFFIQEPGNA